ncbi:MAG: hypothetical protein WB762_00980 [Candidatus Sulfotelmatobacter sp.]
MASFSDSLVRHLLESRYIASLATKNPDGSTHMVAVWYLRKARQLTKRAVDSAIRADSKETGAIWQANAALSEAAFGNATEARQAATEGLKLAPTSQGVESEAALGFAVAGDTAQSRILGAGLRETLPAGYADAVCLAAYDSC